HRLEAVGEEMDGVENGKTIHEPIGGRARQGVVFYVRNVSVHPVSLKAAPQAALADRAYSKRFREGGQPLKCSPKDLDPIRRNGAAQPSRYSAATACPSRAICGTLWKMPSF